MGSRSIANEFAFVPIAIVLCAFIFGCTVKPSKEAEIAKVKGLADVAVSAKLGFDPNKEYDAEVSQDESKWVVSYTNKGVRIPGREIIVFVDKKSDDVKVLKGE
jgi:hypothetical protein